MTLTHIQAGLLLTMASARESFGEATTMATSTTKALDSTTLLLKKQNGWV